MIWVIQKFFCIPLGSSLYHHCRPSQLCWLSMQKDVTGNLCQWILRLQEFDVTIKRNSGCLHYDANALLQCSLPTAMHSTVCSNSPCSGASHTTSIPLCPATYLRAASLRSDQMSNSDFCLGTENLYNAPKTCCLRRCDAETSQQPRHHHCLSPSSSLVCLGLAARAPWTWPNKQPSVSPCHHTHSDGCVQ